MDGRRTPPGSPPGDQRRRRSSGFNYPILSENGTNTERTVFYDQTQRLLYNGGSRDNFVEVSAARRGSAPPISSNGSSIRRAELQEAKKLLEFKNTEIQVMKTEIQKLTTEAMRRASQARLYRESEQNLRKELAAAQAENEKLTLELTAEHSNKLKSTSVLADLTSQISGLQAEVRRLEGENSELRTVVARFKAKEAPELGLTNTDTQVLRLQEEIKEQRQRLLFLESQFDTKFDSDNLRREVCFRVQISPGTSVEFTVHPLKDDVKQIALNFARTHRLSREAFRKLQYIVQRECSTFQGQGASREI